MLHSSIRCFPDLRIFLYIDAVAPSAKVPTQLPGFDYVHSLLNIRTRTYEETMQIFEKSNFSVKKEIPISDLPNVYLWVLMPSSKS